jgi:LPXTG-motif cell wall-anchored protein
MRAYGNAFAGSAAYRWLVLAGLAAIFALATVWVLRRRQGSAASRQR